LKDVNKGFSLPVYLNGEYNAQSLAENALKHTVSDVSTVKQAAGKKGEKIIRYLKSYLRTSL